ncbi:MAG: aminodeoxychorismate/anthranilate synthase component II [Bacteroidetes bacterium]|nr:aminodeoxychorismate/anthranilate synthase component II [Bacteroidota bacterium]
MKILLIDNYDSFTYNLVQYIRECMPGTEHRCEVVRNDAFDLAAVLKYDCVVLSPGPGIPKEAGLMPELLQEYGDKIPILGICLGHQAIGEYFGGKLHNLTQVMHGLATPVKCFSDPTGLFAGLGDRFQVGRYHSWVIEKSSLPESLSILAEDESGQIMAIKHKELPVFGLQFHPESILTPGGKTILRNFLEYVGSRAEPSASQIRATSGKTQKATNP